MTRSTQDPRRHGLPGGGQRGHLPFARVGAATMGTGHGPSRVGRSLLHLVGRVTAWFRSDEGPPLTPDEVEERWRLLFRCGF